MSEEILDKKNGVRSVDVKNNTVSTELVGENVQNVSSVVESGVAKNVNSVDSGVDNNNEVVSDVIEEVSVGDKSVDDSVQGSSDILSSLFAFDSSQPSVSQTEKIWGLLSYVPMLSVFALILNPTSNFIKLHGRQGLLLFGVFFFDIFIYLFPYIGIFLGGLVHFLVIVVSLFSMYHAFIGNWWKIPVVGDVAEMIPVDIFIKITREAIMSSKVNDEEVNKKKNDKNEELVSGSDLNEESK